MSLSLADRFWPKVGRCGDGECWPWRAGLSHGYGVFKLQVGELGVEKRCSRAAHNVAFALIHGRWPDPQGLHGCDFTLCCNAANPGHVHEGTQLQNVRECIERGRARLIQQGAGEDNSLAVLTNQQAREIRERVVAGELLVDLAREYPVTVSGICLIAHGKTYQEAGGPLVVGDLRAIRSGRRPRVRESNDQH